MIDIAGGRLAREVMSCWACPTHAAQIQSTVHHLGLLDGTGSLLDGEAASSDMTGASLQTVSIYSPSGAAGLVVQGVASRMLPEHDFNLRERIMPCVVYFCIL